MVLDKNDVVVLESSPMTAICTLLWKQISPTQLEIDAERLEKIPHALFALCTIQRNGDLFIATLRDGYAQLADVIKVLETASPQSAKPRKIRDLVNKRNEREAKINKPTPTGFRPK